MAWTQAISGTHCWGGAVMLSPFTRRLLTRENTRLAKSPTGLSPVGCGYALPTRARPMEEWSGLPTHLG